MAESHDPTERWESLVHVAAAPLWAAVLWVASPEIAFAYFLASRAAYIAFAGVALRAQDERQWWSRRFGPEDGYRRFRRAVSLLMTNDGAAIGLACWLSRGTLRTSLPDGATAGLGAALVAVGIGVKAWAVASIGKGAYYWRSFFIPPEDSRYIASGPYRWLENPMYTLGYAQAYGVALLFRSLPGLLAALVAQSLVLLLNEWAERPHTARMRTRDAGEADPGK